MIQFTHVSKSYHDLNVLERLSFTVRRGETVGILGPSGSGKTTILRLIAGLTEPTTGKITVEGTQLAYVFQEPRLLPWRTVLDNVRAALRAKGLPSQTARLVAREWLKHVGLADFEHYYPAQLSGGMQQRTALARAFATEPDILLLDEPFSSLDVNRKVALLTILQNMIRDTNVTVVYVTHDFTELIRMADRIFSLDANTGLRELDLSNRRKLLLDYVTELLPAANS